MVHVYHGDGKGKTTAAIGLAIRMAGYGRKVWFAQFLKGSGTGELAVFEKIPEITVLRNKKDLGFLFQMSEEEKQELVAMHNATLDHMIQNFEKEMPGLIVFDELTYVYKERLIDVEKLEKWLDALPKEIEVVITGRNPDEYFLNKADYITQMTCERHPFEKHIPARQGVEF